MLHYDLLCTYGPNKASFCFSSAEQDGELLDILEDLREEAQTPTISEGHRSELNTPVVEGIFGEEEEAPGGRSRSPTEKGYSIIIT